MITFTMSNTATSEEVRDALKAEVQRRIDNAKGQSYRFKTKAEIARHGGELSALNGVISLLENLKFVEANMEERHAKHDEHVRSEARRKHGSGPY